MLRVVVLVPWRSDGGWRDRLWEFCRSVWTAEHSWPVFEGVSPDGPFNRSAAVNDAATQAGDWDVAVILDTDVLVDPDAVREAVERADETGRLVITHSRRIDVNRVGTQQILTRGRVLVRPGWRQNVWAESESSCVAVSRRLWDRVGGFDERFRGWGYEDSAFRIACELVAGEAIKLPGDVLHLWHERASTPDSPLRAKNAQLLARYRAASPVDGRIVVPDDDGLIPRIFHRTVPELVDAQLESWWEQRMKLHPDWEFRTYRDPIDPKLFPRTSPLWSRCETGAQKADLIRLEALVQWGGVYVDADCRPLGSHEPLRCCPAYAAWEDETTIPNAVIGARPGHPAIEEALAQAIAGVERRRKTYDTGVSVTTKVWRDRTDMVLFPPGTFYPHHYLQKNRAGQNTGPWSIEEHMWHHSWGDDASRQSIAERQR